MLETSRSRISVAVMLAVTLPLMLAAGVAIHEMAHHGADLSRGHHEDLRAALHGHHHESGVQDHEHAAVEWKGPPIGVTHRATTESPLVVSPAVSQHASPAPASGCLAAQTPRTTELCIWLL